MIIDLFLAAVNAVFGFFDSLLPSFTAPTFLSTDALAAGSVASYIGGALSVVQPILPIDAFLAVLEAALVITPVYAAYTVFQWVWSHVPTIAGFGTGDG